MAEALDLELLQPRTQAEHRLVQQLRVGFGIAVQCWDGGMGMFPPPQPVLISYEHATSSFAQAVCSQFRTVQGIYPHQTPRCACPAQEGNAQQQERAAAHSQGTSMEVDAGSNEAQAAVGASGQPGGGSSPSGMQQARWGRCFYTRLPRFVAAPGATGAELTAVNLDKSGALEVAAAKTGDASGHSLLGELQFSYAAFLFGQSLEGACATGATAFGAMCAVKGCAGRRTRAASTRAEKRRGQALPSRACTHSGFLQWKALLGLFFSCERAPLQAHTGLYVALLRTLRQQLAIGLGNQSAGAAGASGSRRDVSGSGSASSDDDEGAGGTGADEDGGACPLGLPLVEELLPDSFLRRRFSVFFELLQEARDGSVPPALAHEVESTVRGPGAAACAPLALQLLAVCCFGIAAPMRSPVGC